jgi:serine/threonine-protein kinase
MGTVWEGVHATLATRVAVKFIDADHANSPEARSRFENEARAAASLRSKYVVEVYDHGVSEDGRPFIVMEYLDGEPLDRRLDRLGRLPPKDTALILHQVCRALAKAHAARIVHRDLKPENVFLVWDDEDGTDLVKVVDFGIAKFTDGSLGPSSATRTGSVLGTPYYMSPEQARGLRSVDYRTDIWSLGVIAYRCIVGVLPFEGEAIGDLLVKLCTSPIPVPSRFAPDVPPGFDAFIARALARDPAERFQSVQDFGASLCAVCGISVRGIYGTGETPQVSSEGTGPHPAISGPAAVTQVASSAAPVAVATGAPLSQTAPTPTPRSKTRSIVAASLAALVVSAIGVGVLAKLLTRDSNSVAAATAPSSSSPSGLGPPRALAQPAPAASVVAPTVALVPAAGSTPVVPALPAPSPPAVPVAASPRPRLGSVPQKRSNVSATRPSPATPLKDIDLGY